MERNGEAGTRVTAARPLAALTDTVRLAAQRFAPRRHNHPRFEAPARTPLVVADELSDEQGRVSRSSVSPNFQVEIARRALPVLPR